LQNFCYSFLAFPPHICSEAKAKENACSFQLFYSAASRRKILEERATFWTFSPKMLLAPKKLARRRRAKEIKNLNNDY